MSNSFKVMARYNAAQRRKSAATMKSLHKSAKVAGSLIGATAKLTGATAKLTGAIVAMPFAVAGDIAKNSRQKAQREQALQLRHERELERLQIAQEKARIRQEKILAKVQKEKDIEEATKDALEINSLPEKFLHLIENMAEVSPLSDYAQDLASLQAETYDRRPFSERKPVLQDAIRQLELEADEKVKSVAFWSIQSKKQKYIADHQEELYRQLCNNWRTRRQQHEASEDKAESSFNKEKEENISILTDAIQGSADYIENEVELALDVIDLPVPCAFNYMYAQDQKLLEVTIGLPNIKDMPQEKASVLKNGTLKTSNRTQTELRNIYSTYVLSIAILYASHFFSISPKIKRIFVNGYNEKEVLDGGDTRVCIYSICFTRNEFQILQEKGITDPIEFIGTFKHNCNMTSTKQFKAVKPLENLD